MMRRMRTLRSLPVLLLALAAPACAFSSSADGPSEEGVGTTSEALCFPPVYAGTVSTAPSYVSWQSPFGYQNSCDGMFWTQATIGANTGSYTKFWASVDMRTIMTAQECATTRLAYQLYGKSGQKWAPLHSSGIVSGTWDAASGYCRMNATYSIPIANAKSYGTFMLGGTSNAPPAKFWPVLDTMGLGN